MVTTRTSTRAAAAAVAMLAASASASASFQNEPRQAADSCDDVHIFLARGNNEPYPGRQSQLVREICKGVGSCDYEDLHYSAKYTDLYCQIAYDGVIAGHTQLAAYASRCPDSKLILGGYSVGAQVITDILAGAGATLYNGCVQPSAPPLSRDNAPGNMIAAVIVSGNVRHTGGQSYNTGSGSDMSGLFPRVGDQEAALNNWADILRDECVDTDPICGDKTVEDGASVADHLSYYDKLASDFGKWVKKVAKIEVDSDFTTAIPTSVSGLVQNYATIGTETPSGSVTMSPDWTKSTSVIPVTTTSTSSSESSTESSESSTTSTSESSNSPTETPTTEAKPPTASPSEAPSNAANRGSSVAWTLLMSGVGACIFAI